MDLNQVTAKIRPRSAYEAMDLGFLMVRQWWKPIFGLWFGLTLPVFLVLFASMHHYPYWAGLIFWWLKPVWETVLLHFFARKLFSDQVNAKQIFNELPSLLLHNLIQKLALRRLSLSRSFDLPVGELERLSGSDRNRRLNVLHRQTSSAAIWLTATGSFLESILVIAMFVLVFMFIPNYIDLDLNMDELLFNSNFDGLVVISWYLAISLITPFYVACGFCLYINRRTLLEGWDIELTFKQIAQKAASINPLLVVVLFSASLMFANVEQTWANPSSSDTTSNSETEDNSTRYAEPQTPDTSRKIIIEVVEGDAFNNIDTSERWRLIKVEEEEQEPEEKSALLKFFKALLEFMATSFEAILWGIAIALILFLLIRYRHIKFPMLRRKIDPEINAVPEQLFGLDLRRESLPDSPLDEAKLFWHEKNYRAAYSLLYRAALSHLLHIERLPLQPSHTEQECVALFHNNKSADSNNDKSNYFSVLTQQWIALAYGHQPPSDVQFETLCRYWPDHFEVTHKHSAATRNGTYGQH